MINKNNYFEHSRGVFKMQPTSWAAILSGAIKHTSTGEFAQEAVALGNRKWFPNFVSYSERWGTISAYWVSEDGQYLIRLSDHWSKAPKGIHQCGNIRHCWWELSGRRQSGYSSLWAGIIKFSDLVEN